VRARHRIRLGAAASVAAILGAVGLARLGAVTGGPAASLEQAPAQMELRPYVRLGVYGLIEIFKNPVIKDGTVTDYGQLVEKFRGEYSSGSGTVITPDGLIVTNHHVIESLLDDDLTYNSQKKELIRFTPSQMYVGEVDVREPLAPVADRYIAEAVAWDDDRDVALVRIAKDAKTGAPVQRRDFAFARLGNPYAIPVLAQLTVLGFPGKGGRSINPSSGPFQGFTFDVDYAMDGSIKTSAQIAAGNSGGAALYDNKLVAIPTRVSDKAERGSDFGYLHPITWGARVLSYAQLRFNMPVPILETGWLDSRYNTDESRTMSYLGARIVSGQSQMPVTDATMIVHRQDRTLQQIVALHKQIGEIRTVLGVQSRARRGMTDEQIAQAMKLTVPQVRAYRDMNVDMKAMPADVQAYDNGEFFYDYDDSVKDGFVFIVAPRNTTLSVAVVKDGFRDFNGTLRPVTTVSADMGRIAILMK
jgi:S1-C subfamily serine protease